MQFENLYHDEHTLTMKSIDGKVRKNFFPHRMMHVLSSPSFADCVTWREDGNAFVFLDQDKFVEKLAMIPAESPGKKKSFTSEGSFLRIIINLSGILIILLWMRAG